MKKTLLLTLSLLASSPAHADGLTGRTTGGGGGSPTGSAGGDLGGTYPNPSVVAIQGKAVYPGGDTTTGASLSIGSGTLASQSTAGTAAYGNTAFGYQVMAGTLTTAALNNAGYGYQSLNALTSGTLNSAFGASSGKLVNSGGSNALFGYNAGSKLTSGGTNVIIGPNVASTTLATGSGNILIGTSSAIDTTSSSTGNTLNIGGAITGTGLGTGVVMTLSSGGVVFGKKRSVVDANYTLSGTDFNVSYTSLTAARTVTLPAASAVPSQYFIIKDEAGTAGTNNITISGTVDGSASNKISSNYGSIQIYSNGANYFTW